MDYWQTVNHDSNEKRPGNSIWWLLFGILAFCWVVLLYDGLLEWVSIALGASSGMILATWAIEITGNKVPDSWRRNPPRS